MYFSQAVSYQTGTGKTQQNIDLRMTWGCAYLVVQPCPAVVQLPSYTTVRQLYHSERCVHAYHFRSHTYTEHAFQELRIEIITWQLSKECELSIKAKYQVIGG